MVVGAGSVKREGEGEELVMERFKRPRVRKGESDKNIGASGGGGEGKEKESGSGKGGGRGAGTIMSPGREALAGEGLLDPAVLTPKVWSEVLELFQLHFGTDLPVLHAPTFLPPLHGAAATITGNPFASDQSYFKEDTADTMPGCEMLLLGILALTAKFHASLTAKHCTGTGEGSKDRDPIYASEVYATALRSLLVGERGAYIGQPNLSKIQALLMLGLHEWGMCRGIKGWIHVGLAIRMAQAMGLQFDDDSEVEPWALSSAMDLEAQHLGVCGRKPTKEPKDPLSAEAFVDEEMRRRTFWSCFIMDRYLSSGKYRPAMLALDDVRLQLPCGERAWIFGDRVCTGLISGACSGTGASSRRKSRLFKRWKEGRPDRPSTAELNREAENNDDSVVPCEWGTEEGLQSRFVRIVEIWGRIAKWSCAGGRRYVYSIWHAVNVNLMCLQY